jgi:hypothetical protein
MDEWYRHYLCLEHRYSTLGYKHSVKASNKQITDIWEDENGLILGRIIDTEKEEIQLVLI